MTKITHLILVGGVLLSTALFAQKKKSVTLPKNPVPANVLPPSPVPARLDIPVETLVVPPQKVTTVEGVTEYMLSNGLKVLLFPDPSKQTITVNITYLVGSRHENYGETGMAHLLEHLVFKGTPKHPNVPQELTAHGANPNGTTWLDRTNYFEIFQANEGNFS
jgi:zinc protease